MGNNFYDNLLRATDNTDDITTEKYATVTKLNGNYCDVKEEDTGLEHTNVPIVNGANLSVGDKAIIGFLNNSIYDVVVYGALDKTVHDTTKQDKLISGENIKTINNNSILGSGNLVIEGGGTGVDIVTEWETTTSDSKVASEKLTKDTLDIKVDKENGKGLSSNDFTNNYKSTMDSLKTVATTGSYTDLTDKPSIPTSSSDLSDGSDLIKKSSTSGLLKNDGTVDTTSYSTFSGSYNDLSNKPSIPSSSSDLSDGSDLVKKSNTSGLLKNDGSVDTTQYLSSLPSHNHDDRYYTESEVDTALNGKQATLISGTNIKTINNTSLLGSGNISIQGGGTVTVDDSLSTTSTNPVQNKVITGALNGKANSSHTHTKSEITDLIDAIYPIGSIYMSVNSVNPSTLFGGTWEQIKDTFLLSSGDTYSNGATGGSATVSLSASQMPRHNHSTNSHSHTTDTSGEYFVTSTQSTANNTRVTYSSSGNRMVDGFNTTNSIFHHRANTNSQSPSTKYTGGTGSTEAYSDGSAHENMPPYLAVNVWKRTA